MSDAAAVVTGSLADQPDELDLSISARRAVRVRRRRTILGMVCASYVIDGMVLLIYAAAGTISFRVGLTYGSCGLAYVTLLLVLSEAGVSDRFKDHYAVIPQVIASITLMLAFMFVAPQVGIIFLSGVFVVCSFSALRTTLLHTAITWTVITVVLAAFFFLTDAQMGIPTSNDLERVGSLATLVLTIGRCMLIGHLGRSLRDALYRRGVELKAAYEKIEELAQHDELTGALNRRRIMRQLSDELDRMSRTKRPFAVAMIDLDWFKRINDTHGHLVGDDVLRTFAITVVANLRSSDRFGRYGGEEFLLVLPDTTREEAFILLDRLRQIVSGLDWGALNNRLTVSMSAGLAMSLPRDISEELVARADAALYQAKARGRNRVENAEIFSPAASYGSIRGASTDDIRPGRSLSVRSDQV